MMKVGIDNALRTVLFLTINCVVIYPMDWQERGHIVDDVRFSLVFRQKSSEYHVMNCQDMHDIMASHAVIEVMFICLLT